MVDGGGEEINGAQIETGKETCKKTFTQSRCCIFSSSGQQAKAERDGDNERHIVWCCCCFSVLSELKYSLVQQLAINLTLRPPPSTKFSVSCVSRLLQDANHRFILITRGGNIF